MKLKNKEKTLFEIGASLTKIQKIKKQTLFIK